MIKCSDCGNTEKFIGYAEESGEAVIYLDNSSVREKDYEWSYLADASKWHFKFHAKKCFYCNSENIENMP